MSSIDVAGSSTGTIQNIGGRRIIAGLLLFAAVFTVAYWVIWFTNRDILASTHTIQYFTFENAFPAADGWVVISALLASVGLLRARRWGIYWAIVAAGSGIYLGCMDVLFDLENGIYTLGGAAIVEIVINVLTFGLGLIGLMWAWRAFRQVVR
jgi:uncharacterized membrane protein (DUF2068 family)